VRGPTAAVLSLMVAGLVSLAQGNAAPGSQTQRPRELVFSSDWAADLHNRELYVLGSDGRRRVNVSRSPGVNEGAAALSPDGKTIAYTTARGAVLTVPVAGGVPRLVADVRIPGSTEAPLLWTPDGELSFVGTVDGRSGLFRVDTKGGRPRLVLANLASPAWSPDGRRVAFVRQEPGACATYCPASNVYVANADGTEVKRVTENAAAPPDRPPNWVIQPAWSPDGARIAYVQGQRQFVWCGTGTTMCPAVPVALRIVGRDGAAGAQVLSAAQITGPSWSATGQHVLFRLDNRSVAVVRPDGSGLRRLAPGTAATWSPDGSTIALLTGQRLVTVRADGSGLRTLWSSSATAPRRFGAPSWSPDGRRLIVTSGLVRNDRELYRIRDDGTGMRPLTRNTVPDRAPAVSPNGRLIAFERGAGSDRAVWVMRRDGSGQRRVGRGGTPAWWPDGRLLLVSRGSDVWLMRPRDGVGRPFVRNAFDPAWAPDGRSIVFARSAPEGASSIHRLDLGSGRTRRLTRGALSATEPAWSPDGTRIVFSSAGTLYVMRRDGTRRRPLVRPCRNGECFTTAASPSWSPDGTRIALIELEDEGTFDRAGLHVISAAGRVTRRHPDGSPRPLRNDFASDVDPAWLH
jgi:Tol biopolymer transport system component